MEIAVPDPIDAGVVTVSVIVPFTDTFDVLVLSPVILPCVADVVVIPEGVVQLPEGVVQYNISTVCMVPVVPVVKEKV